jgi:Domain of unknown function (DUF4159)
VTLRRVALFFLLCVMAIAVGVSLAQPGRRGRGRGRSMPGVIPEDRAGVPDWKIDERFKNDVFTFVRIEYDDGAYGGGRRGGWGGWGWARWSTDFPDSDLNFSYRLQQLTSLKVNPNPKKMRLTDPELFDYPFIYIIEPGQLVFREEEVTALRRYLLNGGFLMVDDFWGDYEWENFHREIKRVFPEPEYDPVELDISHEIFRCVYRLNEKPQVPSIDSWMGTGVTWESEYRHGGNTRDVHYKGISDKENRLMVIICHNTDLGDGWEREGEDPEYFKTFSEKKSYPMGINIVTYAMTH